MDIKLMATLQDKINEWIDESCENAPWELVYHGEDLAKNMVMGAVAVYDMSVNTAKYYEKEIYSEKDK